MTEASPTPTRVLPLALIPLAILFFALMFAGVTVTPPPVRATSVASQFDANAARARFARIIGPQTPHAVDTPAEDDVRSALLREIEALGFRPEVHDSFACRPQTRGPYATCARVQNIIFSLGPEDGPAILAVSHYDSVPAGPGASDDGIGVTAWLEIARVLSHETLRRRVIFLISDGEEAGLIGAYAFGHGDPLMDEVQALVNLEARGTRGPAIFFETNQPNADAVAAFASAPRGIGNSVAADVYKLLPNSTDVSTLTRPGLDIVNIAIVDGLENYHTPNDTLANADLRSVQHMGDIGLEVTRRFARSPDGASAVNMTYTDIASRAFVAMPAWLAQAILALSALIALAAFWRAGGEARWRTFAAPLLGFVVTGVLAGVVGFAFSMLRPGVDFAFACAEPARAWCVLLALVGPVLAWMVLRASRAPAQAEAASLFWFALLGFALSMLLSGASILFVLPALPYALGCLVALVWKPAQRIGAFAAALVAVIVWAPAIYLIELSLGFSYPFANALLAALPILACFGVVVRAQSGTPWRSAAFVLGAGALACVAASALVPSATLARPQPLNISYLYIVSDNEARIVAGPSASALPAAMTGAFHAETLFPGDRAETWTAPTRATPIAAPALEGLAITEEGGEHVVRARLVMNGARRAILRMPLSARPLRAVVNGTAVDFAETGTGGDYFSLLCEGRSCDGAAVTLYLDAAAPAGDWYLMGLTPNGEVPPEVMAMRARRPATATPIHFGDTAATITRLRPIG